VIAVDRALHTAKAQGVLLDGHACDLRAGSREPQLRGHGEQNSAASDESRVPLPGDEWFHIRVSWCYLR
jgi:hypothetical protein